jgi:rhodanese-related sulfurtransferase
MNTALPIKPDNINVSQLRQLMTEAPNVRLLDVRTGGEFKGGHIPGSYNVPLETLTEHAADLADVEHPVVLICRSGVRADQAHDTLAAAGKQTMHVLDGGIDAWQQAGGEVTSTGQGRWPMDRQVRLIAGSMALAGVAASTIAPPAKWLSAGVGAGLAWSAISNTCAMAAVLAKLPYNRSSCDITAVLQEMNR